MITTKRELPPGFVPAVFNTGPRGPKSERFSGAPVTLTAWTHEPRLAPDDVLFDRTLIPGARDGDVAELRPVKARSKKIYFVVKPIPEEVARALPNIQVSLLSGNIPKILDIAPRSKVRVRLIDRAEVEADLVELYIKDTYMTRADMWRISSEFTGTCLYSSKRLVYGEYLRATVHDMYRYGHRASSAYIGPKTKFIYRSESARTIYFIQMSAEMWHFEETGDVMFHKLVNSFLPELLRRWRQQGSQHVVTIVLFTSVDWSESSSSTPLQPGQKPQKTEDFYRVVVDQVHINRWSDIMAALRYEFMRFPREVLQQDGSRIRGRILPAVKGNLLEAISVATSLVSDKFLDRNLRQSNVQVIAVTPGPGIYDVDSELFYQTSRKLLSIEISIDLVCLSRPPLHVTPLFRHKDPATGNLVHSIPSWLDISFWNSTDRHNSHRWMPRCKIHEIQMMGVMENEYSAISIDYLPRDSGKGLDLVMDQYDAHVFDVSASASASAALPATKPEPTDDDTLRPRTTSTHSVADKNPTTSIGFEPVTVPAEAVVSRSDYLNKTTALLENAMRSKPKVSALSALFMFGAKPAPTPVPAPAPAKIEDSLDSLDSVPQTSSNSPSIHTEDKLLKFKRPGLGRRQRSHIVRSPEPESDSGSKRSELSYNNSMWVTISNPSNMPPDSIMNISNCGRWKDVFPRGVKRRAIKWRSLICPAALPLATDFSPSNREFQTKYVHQTYDVTLDSEQEEIMSPGDLIEEMAALRLCMGFQIVTGSRISKFESSRANSNPDMIVQTIPAQYRGVVMYMIRGSHIHRLAVNDEGTINVQLYTLRDASADHQIKSTYHPEIRTKYAHEYERTTGNFFDPSVRNINWNLADQFMAGFDDIGEQEMKMYKIRFVILPVDLPKNASMTLPGYESKPDRLSVEEVRVEGLNAILGYIHKNRYLTPVQKRRLDKSGVGRTILSTPVTYYTGSLLEGVRTRLVEEQRISSETQDAAALLNGEKRDSILLRERFTTSIDLRELARSMQDRTRGVRIADRRWHWKMHRQSFVGRELVMWLVANFRDISTLDDALDYGNKLMKRGLFHHVEDRHSFLDGHYLYQMDAAFVEEDKVDDAAIASPPAAPIDSLQQQQPPPSTKKRILLSRDVRFDIDPAKKFRRPEFLTVHVDRMHNPSNAFHLRFEWLSATPRLIDEAIVTLSRMAERYGLKVVQVPINEICSLPNQNPFASLIRVKLAMDGAAFEQSHGGFQQSPLVQDPLYYHKNLLFHTGFVVDTISASSITDPELEMVYSWGKPFYENSQYIHRSGVTLLQLTESGEFVLMTNSLHIAREYNAEINRTSDKKPLDDLSLPKNVSEKSLALSEQIMYRFKALCGNGDRLKEIFVQIRSQWLALERRVENCPPSEDGVWQSKELPMFQELSRQPPEHSDDGSIFSVMPSVFSEL